MVQSECRALEVLTLFPVCASFTRGARLVSELWFEIHNKYRVSLFRGRWTVSVTSEDDDSNRLTQDVSFTMENVNDPPSHLEVIHSQNRASQIMSNLPRQTFIFLHQEFAHRTKAKTLELKSTT